MNGLFSSSSRQKRETENQPGGSETEAAVFGTELQIHQVGSNTFTVNSDASRRGTDPPDTQDRRPAAASCVIQRHLFTN